MDERLKLIDEVVNLNNNEIARINKIASESRQKMNKQDRKKTSSLRMINDRLGRIKFEILQTLVISDDCPKIEILGRVDLENDIAYYKTMFPQTYMTIQDVFEALTEEYKRNGGNTGLFGFSVSPEWEDKCYSFEFSNKMGDVVYYRYKGIYKC